LADVDGDGRLDLMAGSDNCCDMEPGFFWFRNEGGGRYTARPKVRVKLPGVDRALYWRFRAALADWDRDGRPDVVAALAGTSPGLYLSHGAWSADAEVTASHPVEGSPDGLLHQPCIVDWDRDGRLDLVRVSRRPQGIDKPAISEVVWHRNVAESDAPRLVGPQRLLSFTAPEQAYGLSAGDWDADGWPDLIIGFVRIARDKIGTFKISATGVRVYPRRP
jgi:hypothetical protein